MADEHHRPRGQAHGLDGSLVWCPLYGGEGFAATVPNARVDGSAEASLGEQVVAAVRLRHPGLTVVCDGVDVVPGVRLLGIGGGTERDRQDAARFARRYVACLLYRRDR